MLKGFIDDSGTGGDSTWFVLGGYVSPVDQWTRFDSLWRDVLDASPRIAYFKATEAEHLRGQFSGWNEQDRNAKMDALIDVIAQCAQWPVCARLRQAHYHELVKGQVPERWDSPYYFLFQILIGSCVTLERWYGDSRLIGFVFDSNERFDKMSDSLVKTFYHREFFRDVVDVTYCDDKVVLPLQAADLFAWQTRRAFSVPGEKRRRHYDRSRMGAGIAGGMA